jgi:tetratricopeptide (TPR) repeat protein
VSGRAQDNDCSVRCRRKRAAVRNLYGLGAFVLAAALSACAVSPKAEPEPVAEPEEEVESAYVIREEVSLSAEHERIFRRALQHLQAEEYEEGIALLAALTEDPLARRNTAPHINLAMAYRSIGKIEDAKESLENALAINPGHPVANNEYGIVLRRSGRFDEARSTYERLLEAYSEFLPARKNLAILCDLFIGDLPCALENYSIYSAAVPEDENVSLWIADLERRLGN